jgi:hypothetical protein
MQKEKYLSISTSSIIAFVISTIFICVINTLVKPFEQLTTSSLLCFIGLSAVVFVLPVLIYDEKKPFTIFVISYPSIVVVLGFSGYILGEYSTLIGYLGLILPVLLILKQLRNFKFIFQHWMPILFSFLFFAFIIFTTYCTYHKIFYLQYATLGDVHIDILFHSALCNSFDFNAPSVMLDGLTPFKYHWGSHFLFNGMKNIIGISGFGFYNLAYPLILVPLFVQSIVVAVDSFFESKNLSKENMFVLIFCFLAIFISLDKFSYFGQPVGSESFTMSLMFSFFTLALLFKFTKTEKPKKWMAIVVGLVFITYFMKISTGLILAASFSYLLLKRYKNWSSLGLIILGNLLISIILFYTIFPEDRVGAHDTLVHRYHSFWKHTQGIFDYLSAPILLLCIVLIEQSVTKWSDVKKIFWSNEYIDLEFLSIASIVGVLGGIAVSNHGNDIIYFSGVQFYLCFPIFIYLIYKLIDRMKISGSTKKYLILIFSVLSLLSKPEGGKTMVDHLSIKNDYNSRKYNTTWSELLIRLQELYSIENKKDYCIYVQKDESWFYNGLNKDDYLHRDEIESPFVVPAISGIPLISGISSNVLESDYPYYGVYYHRMNRNKQAQNLEEALNIAKAEQFKYLIHFSQKNNKLVEEKLVIN